MWQIVFYQGDSQKAENLTPRIRSAQRWYLLQVQCLILDFLFVCFFAGFFFILIFKRLFICYSDNPSLVYLTFLLVSLFEIVLVSNHRKMRNIRLLHTTVLQSSVLSKLHNIYFFILTLKQQNNESKWQQMFLDYRINSKHLKWVFLK